MKLDDETRRRLLTVPRSIIDVDGCWQRDAEAEVRWLESHTHEQLRAWLQKAGEELGIRLLPPDDEPRKGDMG